MTIYIVRYKQYYEGDVPVVFSNYATSSYAKAKEKVSEVKKMPQMSVEYNTDGEQITKYQPKTQADVIDLINNLQHDNL